jgi:hypothetical protein
LFFSDKSCSIFDIYVFFLILRSYYYISHKPFMTAGISMEELTSRITDIRKEVSKKIVGQEILIRNILIAIFSEGHILLE